MRLCVTPEIYLSPFTLEDADPCVALLGDRAIYERTLQIPHPYERHHFTDWFQRCRQQTDMPQVHLAIRDEDDRLLGAIGSQELIPGHKASLGYWLGRPFWGRGIMTAAVGAFCEHLRQQFHLVRMWATVFEGNLASARVLEKNGFAREGVLQKHYRKDQQLLNGWLYAQVA